MKATIVLTTVVFLILGGFVQKTEACVDYQHKEEIVLTAGIARTLETADSEPAMEVLLGPQIEYEELIVVEEYVLPVQMSTTVTTEIYKVTAYCDCKECCGKTDGITASGKKAKQGRTVAAPPEIKLGTKLDIDGKIYVAEDRGGAIKGYRIDIFFDNHEEALSFGVKYLPVTIKQGESN